MSRGAASLAALALLAACGDDLTPDVCGRTTGDGPGLDVEAAPCELLSSYGLFADGPTQRPAPGVVPYDVNTPLYSDHAGKHRFVWLPPDASASYRDEGPLAFPVGSVLVKTFAYRADLGDPASPERLVETRLLVKREAGWEGLVYLWDEAQTDAVLARAGAEVPVSWLDESGAEQRLDYLVPNVNQCKNCHENRDVVAPIGPRAGHLNRSFDYEGGAANQLARWSELGLLTGAPAPGDAPRTPVWDDPSTGDVTARARAWLDVNCAHCHNPDGPARTSGLDLRLGQDTPSAYGVCKAPVAAGGGSGGRQYNIVPGAPDESILVYRIESVAPDVRMPELLRQTVDEPGVELVRTWIAAMDGSCGE